MTRKILFVFDVQTHFITGEDPLPEAQKIVATIRKLVDKARQASPPAKIIWVRHDSDTEELFFPNTPPWEIAAGLAPPTDADGDEPIVSKTKRDTFTSPRFGELIDAEIEQYKDEGVELYFTGVQSEKCVQLTLTTAIERYKDEPAIKKFAVVKDGHATYDIPEQNLTYRQVADNVNKELAAIGAEVVSSDSVF